MKKVLTLFLCFVILMTSCETPQTVFERGKTRLVNSGFLDVREIGFENNCKGCAENQISIGFSCFTPQGHFVTGCFCYNEETNIVDVKF